MAKPTTLTLTLIFYVTLIFTLAASSDAKSFQHIQRHDHASIARFVTKRSPRPQDSATPLIAVAPSSATPTSVAPVSSTSSAPPSVSESSKSTSAPTSSSSSTTLSQSETTTSARPSTTPGNAPKPIATPPPEQPVAPPPPPPPPADVVRPTITRIESVDGATATSTEEPSSLPQESSMKTKASNPLSVMVMVGASVAGSAILWTVFRKWKLKRSAKFDARMRPITADP